VKRPIWIAAAAVLGALALLRPIPPPKAAADAVGWTPADPSAHGGRARRSPAPHAMVYVAGDVARPGVYAVGPEARTRDALALAGGAKADADLIAVNLAAHVADGDEIVVPVRGSPEALAAAAGPRRRGRGHGHRSGGGDRSDAPHHAGRHGKHRRAHERGVPPAGEVDINTADAETLATIPGIGGGLAERIVAFREQNGPFASVDELLDVAGITEHRLDAIIPYVVAR
jgi:competence protein ComEA